MTMLGKRAIAMPGTVRDQGRSAAWPHPAQPGASEPSRAINFRPDSGGLYPSPWWVPHDLVRVPFATDRDFLARRPTLMEGNMRAFVIRGFGEKAAMNFDLVHDGADRAGA